MNAGFCETGASLRIHERFAQVAIKRGCLYVVNDMYLPPLSCLFSLLSRIHALLDCEDWQEEIFVEDAKMNIPDSVEILTASNCRHGA